MNNVYGCHTHYPTSGTYPSTGTTPTTEPRPFTPEALGLMNYQMMNGDSRGLLNTAMQNSHIGDALRGFIGEENTNKLIEGLTEGAGHPHFRMDNERLREEVGEMLLNGDLTHDQASRIVNSDSLQYNLDSYSNGFSNIKDYMIDQGYGVMPHQSMGPSAGSFFGGNAYDQVYGGGYGGGAPYGGGAHYGGMQYDYGSTGGYMY